MNRILSFGSAVALLVGVAYSPVQVHANPPSRPQATVALPPEFNRAAYNPAVLHLQFTPLPEGRTTASGGDAFLDCLDFRSQYGVHLEPVMDAK